MTEDEILRLIRLGINDPGSVLLRGVVNADGSSSYDEGIGAWGARAVYKLLTDAGLLLTSEEPEPQVRHFRVGPGRCNCGFDAYKVAYENGILMPDYFGLLADHIDSVIRQQWMKAQERRHAVRHADAPVPEVPAP